jgi:hypothetical protein
MRSAAGDRVKKYRPTFLGSLASSGALCPCFLCCAAARKKRTAHARSVKATALVREPPTFVITGIFKSAHKLQSALAHSLTGLCNHAKVVLEGLSVSQTAMIVSITLTFDLAHIDWQMYGSLSALHTSQNRLPVSSWHVLQCCARKHMRRMHESSSFVLWQGFKCIQNRIQLVLHVSLTFDIALNPDLLV